MTTTLAPSLQPATCSGDQDCQTFNARCYPGVSLDAVTPSQIPLNNSLHCYCNLMYHWIGPECSQLSWQSIVMGISNIIMAIIGLLLAVAVFVDIVRFKQYWARQKRKFRASVRRPLVHAARSTQITSPKAASSGRLNCCCPDSDMPNRLDMYMVTSFLLFLALITMSVFTLLDTAQIWTLKLYAAADGVRHSCLWVVYSVFRCLAPICFVSLMLLLSVLMYNASFRANGLSYLPCASFWTLMILDSALVTLGIVASVLDNLLILSYSGAIFAFLAGGINFMTCYRLRDFSFLKLVLQRWSCGRLASWQEDRPQWTIKQRLMAISLTVCILDLLIGICLILRGAFLTARLPDATIIADYIFRWGFLEILVVYFCLIHYNSKQRILAMAHRLSVQSPRTVPKTEMDRPDFEKKSSTIDV